MTMYRNPDIENAILDRMSQHTHALVASAWFTNKRIRQKAEAMKARVVVSDKHENAPLGWHVVRKDEGAMMHYKFMVLGNGKEWKEAIFGSYNFTENANRNDEYIKVSTDKGDIEHLVESFEALFPAGRLPAAKATPKKTLAAKANTKKPKTKTKRATPTPSIVRSEETRPVASQGGMHAHVIYCTDPTWTSQHFVGAMREYFSACGNSIDPPCNSTAGRYIFGLKKPHSCWDNNGKRKACKCDKDKMIQIPLIRSRQLVPGNARLELAHPIVWLTVWAAGRRCFAAFENADTSEIRLKEVLEFAAGVKFYKVAFGVFKRTPIQGTRDQFFTPKLEWCWNEDSELKDRAKEERPVARAGHNYFTEKLWPSK